MNEIAKRPNKAVYRDGDLCYKVFAADYKKSDIFNEALNQTRVEETGLFIPKVHEVKKLDDGRLAIVMVPAPEVSARATGMMILLS